MERSSFNERWAYGQPHQSFVTPRKRRWSSVAALTTLFMAFAGMSLADQVVNTVDNTIDPAAETETITAGGAGASVGFWVNNNNTDPAGDASGCNAAPDPVTINISVPGNVSASASSVSVMGCGDANAQFVTFSSSVANASGYTISVSSVTGGDAGGLFNLSTATFKLIVDPAVPSDTTAPVITYTVNGVYPPVPDGDNGWYVTDAVVDWTVTDPESAVTIDDGCVDTAINTDTTGTTISCSASSAGGSSGPVDVTIKRDATAPDASLVGGPADGMSYYFGSVPAAPTCSASDPTPGSGLAGACSVAGYSAAVGSHTVTATATDNAGNSSSASATYTVLAWTIQGFYAPVDRPDTFNITKNGSTVPLKFEVFAGPTELTDVSVVDTFVQKTNCSGAGDTDAIEEYTTGSTSLRYDTTGGQFIFNWKTPKTAGVCYKVTMTTDDGSSIYANFNLK